MATAPPTKRLIQLAQADKQRTVYIWANTGIFFA